MASIKIETGVNTYDIEDEHGNVRGQISFNPTDMNFYKRAMEFSEAIDSWLADVQHITQKSTDKEVAEEITEFDNKVKSQINELFGDKNTSNVVFGNQNAFNTLNGVTFIERFLNAFMPIIEAEFKKEMDKSKQHIEKYTEQVK